LLKVINASFFARLIKAGLVHVEFKSIHPFSDDNGRLGAG